MDNLTATEHSPFHHGERAVQTRAGVRDAAEQIGRRVIRDHLPDQHRAFYTQLPFLLVGHRDSGGWPWASILQDGGGPFVVSPDAHALTVPRRAIVADDPLGWSLEAGVPIGVLGIEPATRRRNRMSGTVSRVDADRVEIAVRQTFGNCPQYIQTRSLVPRETSGRAEAAATPLETLSAADQALIVRSDTFFVASYFEGEEEHASNGVDVSHRGGRPGFVRVDDEGVLTIPDYAGNSHFNTLGNVHETGRAGLLFVDFDSGDLLSLTGDAQILWDTPETEHFSGAERLWQFRVVRGVRLPAVLPFTLPLDDFSPNSLLTGTWEEAREQARLDGERQAWREHRVTTVVEEAHDVRSLHLEPVAGAAVRFSAGQFLTLRVTIDGETHVRTYTVSSAPDDAGYRISVKRDPRGRVSRYLHEQVTAGAVVEVRAPTGAFTLEDERPAVFLAAGIGITPFLAMLKQSLHDTVKRRSRQPITVIQQIREPRDRAFAAELAEIEAAAEGRIRVIVSMSRPGAAAKRGRDYHHAGRIDRELLQSVLPIDAYRFYLCGPAGFMQDGYDLLRSLGIADADIHAEAFGPSALERSAVPGAPAQAAAPAASAAVVEFARSGFEQVWTPTDGSLLEFAEAHGLAPDSGCRSGKCGACLTRLSGGSVTYGCNVEYPLEPGEALLCCARPAAAEGGEETVVLEL